jgi:hypothetical protein
MKSIRLNKDIRATVVANIKKAYLTENVKPVYKDEAQQDLNTVLLAHYKKVNKEAIAVFETNPELKKYMCKDSYITYRNVEGNHKYLEFNLNIGEAVYLPIIRNQGAFINLSNPDTKFPPAIAKVIENNAKMKKALRKQREVISAYELELSNYIQEVRQVLDGVNTTKQLLEVWPEVEKFLPEGITNPSKINLPSVSIASLNNKLGT